MESDREVGYRGSSHHGDGYHLEAGYRSDTGYHSDQGARYRGAEGDYKRDRAGFSRSNKQLDIAGHSALNNNFSGHDTHSPHQSGTTPGQNHFLSIFALY